MQCTKFTEADILNESSKNYNLKLQWTNLYGSYNYAA